MSMTPTTEEAKTKGQVDWDRLNDLFAQMPAGPWDASRDTEGHEIRQIDTDPTNKHHWPFRLCRSVPGQRAACDDAVFDFIAGVLNAWPQIVAERSGGAEIKRIEALAKRAAGGKWFVSSNGADGLARLDNGTDEMFPVRGEWHEIEFIEALVNTYRNGDLAAPRADNAERTAGEGWAEVVKAICSAVCRVEGLDPDELRQEYEGEAHGWRDTDPQWTRYAEAVAEVLDALPLPVTPAPSSPGVPHLALPPRGTTPNGWRIDVDCALQGLQETAQDLPEQHTAQNPIAAAAGILQAVVNHGYGVFPSSPGVPDSVRALSDLQFHIDDCDAGFAKVPRQRLAEWKALLSAHPAGQSTGQGAETDALVDRFAAALKAKLRAAEAKYGWRNGWLQDDWAADCQRELMRHVGKGDPLDVAAYAAFCWHHGWPTAPDSTRTGQVEAEALRRAVSKALHDNQFLDGWPDLVDPVVDAVLAARPAAPEAQGAETFQARTKRFMLAVAAEDPTDLSERRDRFSEEAMELAGALGATRKAMHELVDYVFGRGAGDPADEMGDTMLCLAGLAAWAGLDMADCGEEMLARRSTPESIAKIRRKRSTRHGRGPLPGIDESARPASSGQESAR